MENELIHDESRGAKIREFCGECRTKTNHEILHSVKKTATYEFVDELGYLSWRGEYQIVQCKGCDTISYRTDSWFSESEDPEMGFDGVTITLYPERNPDDRKILFFADIPDNIEPIYYEIIESFNKQLYLLCAGGIRAIIEGTCKYLGIENGVVPETHSNSGKAEKKNNLQGKIYGLLSAGKIRDQEAEFLHEVRFLGNRTLHELKTVGKEELALSIDIVEHILASIFIISEKGDKLKRLRTQDDDPQCDA